MGDFSLLLTPTAHGTIAGYWAMPRPSGDRPVVVMLHGALRRSAIFETWAELLIDVADVLLIDLPGHGRSTSTGSLSVAAMTQAVGAVIDAALPGRDFILVGESLGGTVALALGGGKRLAILRGILAADPPMTTGKLWNVGVRFRGKDAAPDAEFLSRLGRDAFGILPDDAEELIYYPLIGDLLAPAIIVTGDILLFPRRLVREVERAACVFDDVDRFVIETFYPGQVTLRRLKNCGHLALFDAQADCLAIVRGMIAGL